MKATLAAVALCLAASWSLADGVHALDLARRALATAAAEPNGAEPAPPRDRALAAATLAEARERLGGIAADRAAAIGIRATVAPVDRPGDAGWAARVSIDAIAGEQGLRAFAAALESDRPTIRLVRWTLRSDGAERLYLRGEIVAPWRADALPGHAQPPRTAPFQAAFAAGAGDASAARPGGLTLIGIVGRVPHDAVAMLRLQSGRVVTLGPGARADGWALREIAADRVRIERDGRQRMIVLPPTASGTQ